MKLLTSEWRKLWLSPSFLGLAAALLFLNAILLCTRGTAGDVSPKVWREVWQKLSSFPEEERAPRVQKQYEKMKGRIFTADEYERIQALRKLNRQAAVLQSYEDWLEEIEERAKRQERISIFQREDPFSDRNARKTAEDFADLKGVSPVLINSGGFLAGISFAGTDGMVLGLLFYMALFWFYREKEQGLTALLLPQARGRTPLAAARLLALFLGSICVNLSFWGENLLLSCLQYGAPVWRSPIQSVEGYENCVLKMTVGEYLMVFLACKILISFLIAQIFVFFCLRFRRSALIFLAAGLLMALPLALCQSGDGRFVFQYINLIPLMQVNPIFQTYFNLNLFSWPVNRIPLSLGAVAVLTVFFLLADLYGFASQKLSSVNSKRKRREKTLPGFPRGGLLGQEVYKCLIMQKGLLMIMIFAALQGYLFFQAGEYPGADEIYYRQYMEQLSGPVTDGKLAWLRKENARLRSWEKTLEEGRRKYENRKMSEGEWNALLQTVQDNTRSSAAFSRVAARLTYLKEYGKNTGENPGFVYETGYETLAGLGEDGYAKDMGQGIWLLAISLALCSGIFTVEFSKDMIRLLGGTVRGRMETADRKLLLLAALSMLLFLMAYLPDLIKIIQTYGLPKLHASCGAIPSMASFPMKLWQYLVLLYLLRYLFYFCILLMIAALSIWLRNTGKTLAVGSLLFIFPQVLRLLGITLADCVSFNAFLSGNLFLHYARGPLSLLAAVPVLPGICAWRSIRKSFVLQ